MLVETRAIVLHRSAYNDRYQIVHLYTETHGRLGVLQPLRRSRRSGSNSLAMPILSEIELVGELPVGRQLLKLREFRLYRPNQQIQIQPSKCMQGMFISELLYRVLSAELPDASMYHYLAESLHILDTIERGVANFYLCFTYHLLYHLAIEPTIESRLAVPGAWFDLREAQFIPNPRLIGEAIPPGLIPALLAFSRIHYGNMHRYRYSRQERALIVDYMLAYYRMHLPPFPELRSLEVLRSTSQQQLSAS